MYTLATLGSHHSRPGRNSPSNFVALCRKSSSISLWVPKSSYMQNLLKSYFIQSSKRYVLFLQRFDEECRLFRRDSSLSLQAGLDRTSGQSACGLSRRRPIRAFHPWHAGRVPKRRLRAFSLTSGGTESKSRKVGCSTDHVVRNWIEGLATRDTMSHPRRRPWRPCLGCPSSGGVVFFSGSYSRSVG